MFLLFTDETNLPSDSKAKFFVYGGLVIPSEGLVELDRKVRVARSQAGYKPGDVLKFDTNSRPAGVSVEAATQAKNAVVEACIAASCQFIVYVVLHSIAKNTPQSQLISWGADHVIGKFNYFLNHKNSHGVVVVDRLPSGAEFSYLSTKFSHGLSIQGESTVALDRIKLFASSCQNASHASSAVDIVLGSFRYCINEPKNLQAAKKMMANVTRLVWHRREGDEIQALELGLVMRPKSVTHPAYKAEYDGLLSHINELIADDPSL